MPGYGSDLDDPGLVRAIQAGDQAAISRVFGLCLPSLRSLVSDRFGLSGEEGEDLLQEVRMAFLQSASRFRGGCSLHTYLVRITCQKCADHLPARRREGLASDPGTHSSPNADDSGMLNAMIDRVAAEQALHRLAPREREVMDLFYGQGKSYKEIAAQMRIAVGTVGAMKTEALAKLREALFATDATGSENRDG